MKLKSLNWLLAVLFFIGAHCSAQAQIRITEWMYSGSGGEFVELTNIGNTPIDMLGWSFDDGSQTAGSEDLSAFGVVLAGESVILTEDTAADFISDWSLSGVDVIGEISNNLGRGDEINIYDASNSLIDQLTYDDETIGGVRTKDASGNPLSAAVLGENDALQWTLSSIGDSFGSYESSAGDIGNPGFYAVPEPSAAVLMGLASIICWQGCRRGM